MELPATSIKVESVSPEKAAEFLACNYAHQRKLDKRHAEFLANEMRAGRFISTAEIHIVYRNGEAVLVNGQHTCAAIRIFGKPVSVTVRKTQVREPGEIALVYAFGHDSGKKRGFVDGLGAYNIGEEVGLGSHRLQELSSAIRFMRHGFYFNRNATERVSLPDMLEEIRVWAPFLRKFLDNVISTNERTKRIAMSRGCLSVILVTIRYQDSRALSFWKDVFDPTELQWSDQAAVTRRNIDDLDSFRARNKASGDQLAATASRRLADDWNAWFSKMKSPRKNNSTILSAPIIILGTPYNGEQARLAFLE